MALGVGGLVDLENFSSLPLPFGLTGPHSEILLLSFRLDGRGLFGMWTQLWPWVIGSGVQLGLRAMFSSAESALPNLLQLGLSYSSVLFLFGSNCPIVD